MRAIAEAASVLLARGPGLPEVLVVRRAEQLRFFGGFWAFPGGRVEESDVPGVPGPDGAGLAVRRQAAVRELFEETGVLLARRADGSHPAHDAELDHWRREVTAGRRTLADLLAHYHLAVRPDDLPVIGSLVTPPFTSIRFDTTFFQAELPPGQHAEVWPGELDEGRWLTAADKLDEWTRGQCLVSPPSLLLLEAIRGRPVAEAPARFAAVLAGHRAEALLPIYFAPAVQMIPLRTPGLPPSTHTNAYLVGTGPVYLLDPGATEPAEQQVLFDLLDARAAAGSRLTAVVLSHHHPDHVGAAAACARRYGVPVWAHPLTARALQGRVEVTRFVQEGDRLDLGQAPDGSGPWHLEALHTPGHAAGHLAFYEAHYRLLFGGDLISTLSSIVIAPPDGDLAVYLDSLRRLASFPCRLLLPSHGSPTARPGPVIEQSLAHRAQREEQLLAALTSAPQTAADLADELYKGLPAHLMRFARMQVLAGLHKLQREGRAVQAGDGPEPAWRRAAG